jgi:hypothetical protein
MVNGKERNILQAYESETASWVWRTIIGSTTHPKFNPAVNLNQFTQISSPMKIPTVIPLIATAITIENRSKVEVCKPCISQHLVLLNSIMPLPTHVVSSPDLYP